MDRHEEPLQQRLQLGWAPNSGSTQRNINRLEVGVASLGSSQVD